VLSGVAAAERAGFDRLKINTVIQRGVNDHCVEQLAEHFRGTGHELRLIEFMDVGNLNHWTRAQVLPNAELLRRIHARWPLRPIAGPRGSATALRYEYEDGMGAVGFISSITEPFCGACTRARVTADGTFHGCLFSSRGTLLRPLLRQFEDDRRLLDYLAGLWAGREDRYSELRDAQVSERERVEMYRVGG
jgi:cyclic pyranopterin phosphate synthase